MRLSLAALAVLLSACTPPQPQAPAPQAEAPPSAAAAPAAAPSASANGAILSVAPVSGGRWVLRGDNGDVAAGYGYPESEYVFTIACRGGMNRVTIFWEHDLHPPQDTTLRFTTATQTVDIPARSFLEGYVQAELDGADPRLDSLKDPQELFAVQVAGQANVFLWDESINRALTHCGA